MRRLAGLLTALAAIGAGCGESGGGSSTGAGEPGEVASVPELAGRTAYYSATGSEILNPERGFHKWIDLEFGTDFTDVRERGMTLGLASVSLASYRYSSLSSSFLARLERGFNGVRDSGIKVILRFKYSDGFGDPDASKSRILGHIAQLKPLLQKHADVISVMQAGFIGAWGEWHGSTNDLDNPEDQGDVLAALLDALPSSRMIQVRTPTMKQNIYGTSPLSSSEAWSGSGRARVAHHNDALLGSTTDQGTYTYPVEVQKEYVAQEGRFLCVGGECNTWRPPYTDADNAIAELRRLHYSFLSSSYLRQVLDGWKAAGKYDDISRDLGYRIVLLKATWPDAVQPGQEFALTLRFQNLGYAAPHNARPFYVVLEGGPGGRVEARIPDLDWRRFAPGQIVEKTLRLRTSSGLAPGTYRLALWLPDAASTLRNRPDYAALLATSGIRDPAAGLNRLSSAFVVSGSAGSYTSAAITLR